MEFAKKTQQDVSLWLREEGFSEAIIETFQGAGVVAYLASYNGIKCAFRK